MPFHDHSCHNSALTIATQMGEHEIATPKVLPPLGRSLKAPTNLIVFPSLSLFISLPVDVHIYIHRHICLDVFVCMYVCMYVSRYVCMYVRMCI